MTEQLQLRRGTATQVAAFTGAQGELVVDTTNDRVVVNDGSTAGGWPAAKLSEVVTNARTAVADAAYTAQTTDRLIAYNALSAARIVTLCSAASYPTGTRLMIVDESGNCSSSKTITVSRAGADTISGATGFVINTAFAALELESNGSNAWTILSPAPNVIASTVGIGTAPDPNNPLSVYGAAALFNGTNFNITVNKAAVGGTASLIFEDGFSGRAQMGLAGSDNFSFKVSPNGSAWTTAIGIDATTGAATFANQRTAISDAAYSGLITDRLIAYTALTAARIVTLPAAASYPAGQALTIADESGACSAIDTITVSRAGSDTINGATSAVLSTAYGYVAMESNGSNAWTIIDQATFGAYLASPSPIGATAANTGAFTTLSATGKISGAASTTSAASLNLPQGSAPTSPANGDFWTAVGGVFGYANGMTRGLIAAIGQSHIPFVVVSSGTMGNNGALSAITAVAAAYPSAYVYMPSGAIFSGSAAGWYYADFSSTSAATLYNNTYSAGTPQIPASPTAFSTTGPGAYTQTSASNIASYVLSIPGNTIGSNGSIRISGLVSCNNGSGSKTVATSYGGAQLFTLTGTTTETLGFIAGFANLGVTNAQKMLYSRNGEFGALVVAPFTTAINSTQAQNLTIYLDLASAATDTITLENIVVEHIPGVP